MTPKLTSVVLVALKFYPVHVVFTQGYVCREKYDVV